MAGFSLARGWTRGSSSWEGRRAQPLSASARDSYTRPRRDPRSVPRPSSACPRHTPAGLTSRQRVRAGRVGGEGLSRDSGQWPVTAGRVGLWECSAHTGW